jgi:gamma-glutamylcyclotransferase (GGCT)/AIG2-like uncharacterized protein YtfP
MGDSRLFVYASLLAGEPGHGLLCGAQWLGAQTSEPRYALYDLGAYGALVEPGDTPVAGELYLVPEDVLARIDVARQVPLLFQRRAVRLADGADAQAYCMTADQVRGKRRIRHGDWHRRFASNVPRREPGAFVTWARGRFSRR